MGEGTGSMVETKTTTPSSLQPTLRSRPAAAYLELLVPKWYTLIQMLEEL